METKSFEEWIDLTGVEEQRTYLFPHPNLNVLTELTIDHPVRLFVKKSGSHKIEDAKGQIHYIPTGWFGFRSIGKFKYNVE